MKTNREIRFLCKDILYFIIRFLIKIGQYVNPQYRSSITKLNLNSKLYTYGTVVDFNFHMWWVLCQHLNGVKTLKLGDIYETEISIT